MEVVVAARGLAGQNPGENPRRGLLGPKGGKPRVDGEAHREYACRTKLVLAVWGVKLGYFKLVEGLVVSGLVGYYGDYIGFIVK